MRPSVFEQPADVVGGQRLSEQLFVIHHRGEQSCLPLLEREHLLLDGPGGDHPVDEHLLGLADPMRAVDGLSLGEWI